MIQKEYLGAGMITQCKKLLKNLTGKNILLVNGKNSYNKSKAKVFFDSILPNYNVTIFNKFNSYPKIKDVISGVDLFKRNKINAVIAVGGGRVIDMAKLINFYSMNEMNRMSPVRISRKIKKTKPLIAIPTTAGSGSQATHFAVVYKNNTKYSLAHKYILPDVAIVDSDLTRSLPKKQIAISGMDALAHAVESYWSINSTKESKQYARKAIRLILKNLVMAANKETISSQEAMARAAHLSGKAINITKTTAAHAVSYSLTIMYGVAHGYAVALTLSSFFLINDDPSMDTLNEKRGKKYLIKTMSEIRELFGCDSSQDFVKKWQELMRILGLKTDLVKLGISRKSDIERIIKNVNIERLNNNPVKITKRLLRRIFQ